MRDETESPGVAAARAAREALVARQAEAAPGPVAPAVPDPLPTCIWATVALLAWLLTPALAVTLFAALGFARYLRAWRAGLRTTSCFLRDPRIVMAYLGLLALAGAGWTIWRVAELF